MYNLATCWRKVKEQIQIEQASNRETASQLKNLSDENVHLQEDLVFFQNLTATHGKEGELAIHRLKLERDKMPGNTTCGCCWYKVESAQRSSTAITSW